MVVLDDGERQSSLVARVRVEAVQALHDAPAVVLAARVGGALKINLLETALPNVADVEVCGRAVE